MKLREEEKTFYPFGKLGLFFNVIVLCLSVGLMLYIIFGWGFWDYLIVVTYVLSMLVSLLFFHSLKLVLLKSLSSDMEHVEGEESAEGTGKRQVFLMVFAFLLILTVPLIILYIIPDFWLIILNGVIAGASISELILYSKKRK